VKVALVTAVYPPEPVVSSRTSADVAAALHQAGHDVTVISPYPSRPAGELYAGYRRRWRSVARDGGITTVRTFSTLSKRSTLVSRFAENLSFGLSSALALLRVRGLDVIYLNTWPVFATAMVAVVAGIKGVPFVVSVQDVYPESLFAQRRRGAGILGRVLRAIDRWVASRAAALIVLSENFAAIYRDDRGVDERRIRTIPNWIDAGAVVPDAEAGRAYRRSRNIPDDAFVVGYGGNIGVAAAVEQLVEAWQYLADPRIHLLIAGAGPNLSACEALAKRIAPGQIHIQSPWPASETMAVLAAADLLALPTFGDQSLISVPSKMLSYLLAAKPVLACVLPASETAKILATGAIGWSVAPGQPVGIAAAIEAAARVPVAERAAMGERARRTCIETFGAERCIARVLETLAEAASTRSRSR
jgi:glycosyltransferase involved in cell wall biosynthesis